MRLIDYKKIPLPSLEFTEEALRQMELILENDETIKDKVVRLLIDGKGCEGFRYGLGFTLPREDDLVVFPKGRSTQIRASFSLSLDPFTAYYTKQGVVDFIQDFDRDLEGFVVTNVYQSQYSGKFWKKFPEKTPPMLA